MNKVFLMGRVTKDPEIIKPKEKEKKAYVRYTVAVDGVYRKDSERDTYFISLVAFGHTAEFISKYFSKGERILVEAHIVTSSYENEEKKTVYTTTFFTDSVEFADRKKEKTSKNDNPFV